MSRWFRMLPVHRKLVVTSMLKTSVVLLAAMGTLLLLDYGRFERAARTDVESLAAMVAENVRAAVTFGDLEAISLTLQPLRLRPQIQRACVFDDQSRLLAEYARQGFRCPFDLQSLDDTGLSATAPVEHNGKVVGRVYLDRDWAALRNRMMTAGMTSLVILILATVAMFFLSHRLHRHVSEPIRRLAAAARGLGRSDDFDMPAIPVSDDEVGELVTAFGAMAARTRAARQDLTRTNENLRREIEERLRIERERESLLRREQEANRIKDEFLATVSHELRTPLNAIVGWSQILATTTPSPEVVAKAAQSLYRNARVQARVIDDLIDISRIVSGKLRVSSDPTDVRLAVDSAVDAIRGAVADAGITMNVSLDQSPCVVLGDPDRLKQVVWNLLANAVKFAPTGQVAVILTCEESEVVLQVRDDGVGIVPAFLPHVFDRFRQADSSVTREHGGLGIGLAVAKELVELHGGTISVASAGRGRGATFTVRLPAAPASQVPPPDQEYRLPSLKGVSVLAVDDNADALDVLQALLVDVGAEVRLATTGAEALEIWRRRPSDVLLCDLAMPGMSGFELVARIREIDRNAGRVTPAIAVTAQASEEQVAMSIQAGFQAHIAKPFHREQLVRAIIAARGRV
jgi:signal transduction histidine kinase/CheY-like chemotaxis protein